MRTTGADVHHQLTAFNTATASANKIHDDAVASSLGFRGGLVPGVDVYAYLCHAPAAHWGRAWLERGTIEARFATPVYDGDRVDIEATTDAATDGDAMTLALTDSAGGTCATGLATLPDHVTPLSAADIDRWPLVAAPDDRPPATPETLTARPFGCIAATFHADRAGEYLDDIREDLPVFRDGGPAHPGWLLRYANYVLTANVTLGPWIHVESHVQLLGVVEDGDTLETRAVVTGVHERRGHRFVDLDVLQIVGDRPVARPRAPADRVLGEHRVDRFTRSVGGRLRSGIVGRRAG
jgi:acyl dehydratase